MGQATAAAGWPLNPMVAVFATGRPTVAGTAGSLLTTGLGASPAIASTVPQVARSAIEPAAPGTTKFTIPSPTPSNAMTEPARCDQTLSGASTRTASPTPTTATARGPSSSSM